MQAAEILDFSRYAPQAPQASTARPAGQYSAILAVMWTAQCLVFRSVLWLLACAYGDFLQYMNGWILAWKLNSAVMAWFVAGASWGLSIGLIAMVGLSHS